MKKKKIIIISLIVIAVIAIVCGSIGFIRNNKNKESEQLKGNNLQEEFVQVLEDGTKLNTSEQLKTTKNMDGLEITNIQLTEQNGQSVLIADVRNTTETETGVIGINIIILDKQENEIGKMPGIIAPLTAGETKQLNVGITEDYSNAYNFRVEKQ